MTIGFFFGSFFGHTTLAAAWAALGPGPIGWRVPLSLVCTDAGLEHVKEVKQLHWLDLRGTTVADAGLEFLRGLTQLQELKLRGSQVTDAGVNELQKALPNCAIHH